MPIENEIRDRLAERLDLIEPFLEVVGTNFPLPNAAGTRGFVDVLARDRHGVLVVVELKRSDSTAREALHEVVKYVELLQRERSIPEQRIRAVVVSTDWRELHVPFSHWVREWSFELTGYELHLDADGVTPVAASKVPALPQVVQRGLTPVHARVALAATEVDRAWDEIKGALAEVGVDDVFGVELAHPARGTCLYVALGTAPAEDARTAPLAELADEIPADSIEAPRGYVVEYRALTWLTRELPRLDWRVGYADKFRGLRQAGWEIARTLRSGIFGADERLYETRTLLRDVDGSSGFSDVRLLDSSRPANRAHWDDFVERVTYTLFGNPHWSDVIPRWLAEVAATSPELDVVVQVFNPCDLTTTLVYGWPGALPSYIPRTTAAVDAPLPRGKLLDCCLAWTGRPCADLLGAFRGVFPSDMDWAFGRVSGAGWRDDLALLDAWGLEYVAVELTREGSSLVTVAGDGLRRTPCGRTPSGGFEVPGFRSLPEFVATYSTEIDELVTRLRAKIVVDPDEAVQLFADTVGD